MVHRLGVFMLVLLLPSLCLAEIQSRRAVLEAHATLF